MKTKTLLLILPISILFSCGQSGEPPKEEPTMDIAAELVAIEETRTAVMLALKEKRYPDLANYATGDIISIGPICGEWEEYRALTADPKGLFSYDSIRMVPQETVIVSDSIAYDFGVSSVYYTNAEGEAVEIKDTFLAIIKKDKKDGVWKLHREVATTNLGQ